MGEYNKYEFGSYLVKGQLHEAINYLSEFPYKKDLHEEYISVFQKGQYYNRTDSKILGSIDQIYQNYYRNVFWMNISNDDAKKSFFMNYGYFVDQKLIYLKMRILKMKLRR